MTWFQHLRERLHQQAGLGTERHSKFHPSDLLRLEQTEWSPKFEWLMRNRLLMGALRYGTMAEKRLLTNKNRWDLVGAVSLKIKKYEETGNTEFLVDAANYCLLAFEFDPHPTKYFHALDDHLDHCKQKPLNSEQRK